MTTQHPRRAGFTLVELMVAMALAVILAGLAVGVVYSTGAIGSQRVVGAADRVSGWLMTAKQRAIRDGNAQGVRFYLDGNTVTEAQYIEKPPQPIVPNSDGDPNGARIALRYELDGSGTAIDPAKQAVFYIPGTDGDPLDPSGSPTVGVDDYLMLSEFATSYRITSIATATTTLNIGSTPTTARQIFLADVPDLAAGHSSDPNEITHISYLFAFEPQPRPLFGEPILQVGEDAALDYRTTPATTTAGVIASSGYFDVMFASNGQMSGNGSTSIVALWVRDPAKSADPFDFANAGEQVLIAIYPKTGSISTTLVNPDSADPHKNAREGINAGL